MTEPSGEKDIAYPYKRPNLTESYETVTQDFYGLDRVADRINVKISIALREENTSKEESMLEFLKTVDEEEEDRLLAIDFKQMTNNFKVLQEEVLPYVTFRMPSIWTKRYAMSLCSDEKRKEVGSQPAELQVPVYEIQQSRSEVTLQQTGETKRPLQKKTRSSTNIHVGNGLEDAVNSTELPPIKPKSELFHQKEYRRLDEKHLPGCVSSHFGFMEKTKEQMVDYLVYEVVSATDTSATAAKECSPDNKVDKAMENLETLDQDIKESYKRGPPMIHGTLISKSGEHISKAMQTVSSKQTSFKAYVSLKRKLAKCKPQDKNKVLKQWAKTSFLKNVSVEEYMSYKKKTIAPDVTGKKSEIPRSALSHQINLTRKKNKEDISKKKRTVFNTGTIAMAPGHSVRDLRKVPSSDVSALMRSIQEDKWDRDEEVNLVQRPSLILPACVTSINSIPGLLITDADDEGRGNTPNQTIDYQSLLAPNLQRVNEYRKDLSQDRFRESAEYLNVEVPDPVPPLPENRMTMGLVAREAQSLISRNLATLRVTNSGRQVADVLNHFDRNSMYKRHCTSPADEDDTISPRQYLSELVIGKRKFELDKTPSIFGYQHAEFGHDLKPVILKMQPQLTESELILAWKDRQNQIRLDKEKESLAVRGIKSRATSSPNLVTIVPEYLRNQQLQYEHLDSQLSVRTDGSARLNYTHKSKAQTKQVIAVSRAAFLKSLNKEE